ncbi:sugar ABC transporter ATP-binding protein [Labrys wisconsinensis]|uniref:Ribose transport system ATP-binding protein n=1 Tax=Labrys wisconsinensis TaxID=425677 RepID=A0ABU0J7V8_9HYPH|nr:sugar ABC transporter ATP-binding protein [Labrys wisconsinensis]MDQ0469606.1 ribose transport system ATP-binding protein [Labrys wisconsinensis]
MTVETARDTPRLEMAGIAKSFSGVAVLRDVALSAWPGEVIALLGANGAGKSTLMKILAGVYASDAGEIRVDGRPVAIAGPQDAIRAGIRLMPQELSAHPDLTVAENICLAAMPVRRALGIPLVDRRAMRAKAADLLARLGLADVSPEARMGSLSLSQQRVVEIARALAGEARILIMDEPTAALSDAEAESLFAVIGALKREGVTVIYISHYLDEVFRLSDRILVLRDGGVAGTFAAASISHEAVLQAMLGGALGDLYPPKRGEAAGMPVLQIEGLGLPGWLEDVSLEVGAGEILGVFGLVGSGIEKLGRAVFGAEPRARVAQARLNGAPYRPQAPRDSVRAGIGFVAAERKREGLIGILTVRENTTLPFLPGFTRFGLVDRAREGAKTRHWIEALGVRTRGPEQEIRLLSGGNQQKICLARWLLGDIRLLVLEEPTRGVDLGARREIYGQIRALAAGGLGVLLVSSDAEEVAGLADRTLVLRDGRTAAVLPAGATAADLLEAAGNAGGSQKSAA